MESRIHREVHVRFGREYGTVEIDDSLCLPYDLDIQVSKLQLLKQSFLSQKYDMEDKVTKQYPREIKDLTEKIADYGADITLVKEHTPSDREVFPVMQIKGTTYDEKQEASVTRNGYSWKYYSFICLNPLWICYPMPLCGR